MNDKYLINEPAELPLSHGSVSIEQVQMMSKHSCRKMNRNPLIFIYIAKIFNHSSLLRSSVCYSIICLLPILSIREIVHFDLRWYLMLIYFYFIDFISCRIWPTVRKSGMPHLDKVLVYCNRFQNSFSV